MRLLSGTSRERAKLIENKSKEFQVVDKFVKGSKVFENFKIN
jgi:hypothetical protein